MIIPKTSFNLVPWKNGKGSTTELLLLPQSANQDNFDIRISLATIPEASRFSKFPGIDRIITLITGASLTLHLADREAPVQLRPLDPFWFDSGMGPQSIPSDETVSVLNVMTRRGICSADVRVVHGPELKVAGTDGAHVNAFFALRQRWTASCQGQSEHVEMGDLCVNKMSGELAYRAAPDAIGLCITFHANAGQEDHFSTLFRKLLE